MTLVLAVFFQIATHAAPVARVSPTTETLHGQTVVDPYRWMEAGVDDKELADWMKAQDAAFRAALQPLAARRAELLTEFEDFDRAAAISRDFRRTGERIFYLELEPTARVPKLKVKVGTGPARVLLDPATFDQGEVHAAIDYYEPSQDGRRVAVGLSLSGSEDDTLHVIDVDGSKVLPDAITRTQYASPTWLPDGRRFLYGRLQKLPPGATPAAVYENHRVYLHTVGSDPETDRSLFGSGVVEGLEIPRAGFVGAQVTPGSPFVLAFYSAGTIDHPRVFVEKLSAVERGAPHWVQRVAPEDALKGGVAAVRGNLLVGATSAAHPNRELRAWRLDMPTSPSQVLVPESDHVLEQIAAAQDGLYLCRRAGTHLETVFLPGARAGTPQPVALPFDGAVSNLDADPRQPGALVVLQSWTRSPRLLSVRGGQPTRDLGLIPLHPADFSGIEEREATAHAPDGTALPVTLFVPRAAKPDHPRIAEFEGYGAYGISVQPRFGRDTPYIKALVSRGGVFAFAHPRGGGEFGERWHDAGRLANKQHTIDDMLATARFLVDSGWTKPEMLAVRGTSAGGIAAGGAVVQHPELFGVLLDNVGMTDLLRFQSSQGGAANVPEFGDVQTPGGFRTLAAVSPYNNVKNGVRYPSVLAITGLKDPRVPSWQVAKFVARMQAATSSGRPVFLRVDADAGHGWGSTRTQLDAQLADEMTFTLWQLGHPDFQLTAKQAGSPR